MNAAKLLSRSAALLSGLLVWAGAAGRAWSQDAAAQPAFLNPDTFTGALVGTVVFGLIGTAMAILGFKIFDWVVPFDLEREIAEKNNMSVAIVAGAMVLGISLIVAAAVN
ncbi:MAG: DUF350 domain-containing protein [Candidatus Sericytochromatia bacterium]|nr:DUF350 domain-containing protein [Candidatus Tanganyikabacteria bacterium]